MLCCFVKEHINKGKAGPVCRFSVSAGRPLCPPRSSGCEGEVQMGRIPFLDPERLNCIYFCSSVSFECHTSFDASLNLLKNSKLSVVHALIAATFLPFLLK